jgi:hypothetical protein
MRGHREYERPLGDDARFTAGRWAVQPGSLGEFGFDHFRKETEEL